MGIKQKKIQNGLFSKSPILKNFSRKFLRSVLGLVGLNDAKGIDVAQRIWLRGCPTKAQKQPKNAFLVLFGYFWAFVGQPHGHIHWAKSMPFASSNPTNPRTNLRNFREKILRIGDFKKWAFFESAILNFFFEKKKFFLLHSHENRPKFIWLKGWVKILTFSLVSRKFLAMRNILLYSVRIYWCYITFFQQLQKQSFTQVFKASPKSTSSFRRIQKSFERSKGLSKSSKKPSALMPLTDCW